MDEVVIEEDSKLSNIFFQLKNSNKFDDSELFFTLKVYLITNSFQTNICVSKLYI